MKNRAFTQRKNKAGPRQRGPRARGGAKGMNGRGRLQKAHTRAKGEKKWCERAIGRTREFSCASMAQSGSLLRNVFSSPFLSVRGEFYNFHVFCCRLVSLMKRVFDNIEFKIQ